MPIDIPAACLTETEASIQVRVSVSNGEQVCWVPRSAICNTSEVQGLGDRGTLIVEDWVAEKKNWFPRARLPRVADRGRIFNESMDMVATLLVAEAAEYRGPLAECACDGPCDEEDPVAFHVRAWAERLASKIREFKRT